MNYSVKLEDGSEIVLLYTKNFTWLQRDKESILNGSPSAGRVYRALKTVGDNNYYVHLDLPIVPGEPVIEGIRLTKLKYNTPEWTCDFEEINEDNIVDFDIVAEDYKKIGNWLEIEQQDLIDRLFKHGLDVEGSTADDLTEEVHGDFQIEDATKAIMDAVKNSLVAYDNKAIEAIQWISMRDPMGLKAITTLITRYAEFLNQEDKGVVPPVQREVANSDIYGKGANIAYLAKALDEHVRNKTNNSDVIFNMFLPLVFELMRQELN
jgi:hypothetical protein